MWFGVAPRIPSPVNRKDEHPPLCSCALHRLERGKRLEAEKQQELQSPRRTVGIFHSQHGSHSSTGPSSSRQRVATRDKTTATPRRHEQELDGRRPHGRSGRDKEEPTKQAAGKADDTHVVDRHFQSEHVDELTAELHESGRELLQLMEGFQLGDVVAVGKSMQPQFLSKQNGVRAPGDIDTPAWKTKSSASIENQDEAYPATPRLGSRLCHSSIRRTASTPPTGLDEHDASNNNSSSIEWSSAPAPFVSLRPEHLVGHTSSVCALVAHDDRFIVSCSVDGSVKVWSQITFDCLHTIYGHRDVVSCIDLNTRWLVSGSHDCTLRLYDCTNSSFELLQVFTGHSGHVTHVRVPPALPLYIVSCSDDFTLCVWNGELGQCTLEMRAHHSRVTCFDIQADHICSGAADGSICFWDIGPLSSNPEQPTRQTIACTRIYYAHKSTVQCIADLTSSKNTPSSSATRASSELCSVVVSGSNDGTIQLFSAKTFAHLGRLDVVGSPVYAMVPLSNGRLLCSTKDGRLLLYGNLFRPTSRRSPAVLQLATKWISSLQVCGDSVACSSEEVLYIVDTARMCVALVFETQHSFITCTRWIRKNALITAGQDNVIKQWKIA